MNGQIKVIEGSELYGKSIAIISDIHSNIENLDIALQSIREKKVCFVFFLGDLWTYGCHPLEVAERLQMLSREVRCFHILGNHDEFYFNKDNEKECFSYKIPPYIEESVNWTIANTLNKFKLFNLFNWTTSISIGPIFMSHANPFGESNWAYLNSSQDYVEAAKVLKSNSKRIGIFGHTHRRKSIAINNQNIIRNVDGCFDLNNKDDIFILNPGSVGQPRGEGAYFAFIQFDESNFKFEFERITPKSNYHLAGINDSSLTKETKIKLLSFFEDVL
jgi:predicted phosphodiesterase